MKNSPFKGSDDTKKQEALEGQQFKLENESAIIPQVASQKQ